MLLLWGIALGLVIGRLMGGQYGRLAELPLRGMGGIFGVLAVQILLFASPLAAAPGMVTLGPWLFVASIAALAGLLACNRRLGRGVDLALVGLLLNLTVIVANGGRMPARVELLVAVRGAAKAHAVTAEDRAAYATPLDGSSRLAWLGDQIPVRLPGAHGNAYSPGDVLVSAGLGLVVLRGMRGRPATAKTPAVSVGDADAGSYLRPARRGSGTTGYVEIAAPGDRT